MTKLSELDWDQVVFGLKVKTADPYYTDIIGIVTRVTHDGWVQVHWSNGNCSMWPKYYYSGNEVIK